MPNELSIPVTATRSRSALLALAGAIAVLAAHTVVRAWGLFGPPDARRFVLFSFLMLWPTPWVLLDREERRAIGFGAPRRPRWWLASAAAGAGCAALCFAVCWGLFGEGVQNPFVSIRQSFLGGAGIPPLGPLGLFLIFTGPALVFSPIGEEVYCRGVVYGRVRRQWGAAAGALASAGVFASVHLLHHGVTLSSGVLGFIGWSGALWFVLMFGTSLMFTGLRKAGRSIWLAVVSHSAFNLVMNACIFSVLV